MKKNSLIIILIFCINSITAQYDASRFEIILTTSFGGKNIPLKLDNISYSLNDDALYYNETPDSLAPKKQLALNLSSRESLSAAFLIILQKKKQYVSGIIEVKDNFGKLPMRKITFEKALYYITETVSSYDNSNSISLTVMCDILTIDGVKFEK